MKEILTEQLSEYIQQKKDIESRCIELIKQKKEWKELAMTAIGVQMLINATVIELKKYS